MSVSVTQRPPAFAPVNNPVVYKFAVTGGPFTLYRLVVRVYAGTFNALLGTISKSPDSNGDILADISSVLKTVLYRDWSSTNESENFVGSLPFYIKYQEYYTGSATSEISDVGNLLVGVLGARQIGSNANLTEYDLGTESKKFLTLFDSVNLWRGYPLSMSFLRGDLGEVSSHIIQYDINGDVIDDVISSIDSDENALNRAFIPEPELLTDRLTIQLLASSESESILPPDEWVTTAFYPEFESKNPTQFVTINWVSVDYRGEKQDFVFSGTDTYIAPISITINHTDTDAGFIVRYVFQLRKVGAVIIETNDVVINSNGSFPSVFTFPILTEDVDELWFVAENIGTDSGVFGGVVVEFDDAIGPISAFGPVSEIKTIMVKEPCDNPIYLFWKNSIGGDSFWLFDANQELAWNTDSERKAKQLTLFAENLTINEFDTISEVNTPGIVYKPAIPELTTSVNKTSQKIDQQLYVVGTDGSKVGVINLNNTPTTQTMQVKHMISVGIEYPELFL